MKIIITMAGAGSRFTEAGYDVPKHEIMIKGKTLFEWSMISLIDLFSNTFIFVVRKGKYSKDFIDEKCSLLNIQKYEIVELIEITDGQASTAIFADIYIKENEPVLVYNVDTYVEAYSIKESDFSDDIDGIIHVFEAEGEKWSFVSLDNKGNVIEVSEKKRISNLASIGLYYFKEWGQFKHYYYSYKNDIKRELSEIYIAPFYNFMLKNSRIGIVKLDSTKVHILGTPEDLNQFIKS